MDEKNAPFPRDRAGEIFEDDLTEEGLPPPPVREDAAHHVSSDPDTDSQAADDFMKDRKFPKP